MLLSPFLPAVRKKKHQLQHLLLLSQLLLPLRLLPLLPLWLLLLALLPKPLVQLLTLLALLQPPLTLPKTLHLLLVLLLAPLLKPPRSNSLARHKKAALGRLFSLWDCAILIASFQIWIQGDPLSGAATTISS